MRITNWLAIIIIFKTWKQGDQQWPKNIKVLAKLISKPNIDYVVTTNLILRFSNLVFVFLMRENNTKVNDLA